MRRCLLCHELQEEYEFIRFSSVETIRVLLLAVWKLEGRKFVESPSILLGKNGRVCRRHLKETCKWLEDKWDDEHNIMDSDFYKLLIESCDMMRITRPEHERVKKAFIQMKSQVEEDNITRSNAIRTAANIDVDVKSNTGPNRFKDPITIPDRYKERVPAPMLARRPFLSFSVTKSVSYNHILPSKPNVPAIPAPVSSFDSITTTDSQQKDANWCSSANPESDDDDDDDESLNHFYIVKGKNLKNLCRNCPSCLRSVMSSQVRLTSVGSTPVLKVLCNNCWKSSEPESSWFGQDRLISGGFEVNHKMVGAAVTTGMRWQAPHNFCKEIKLTIISRSLFYKYLPTVLKAVDHVYDENREHWLQKVEAAYEGCYNWELAADGAYDSRGYSAKIGKTVLADQKTNLIISLHTMHCSKVDYKSGRMEIAGLRELVEELHNRNVTIKSITTDRSRSFGKLIRELNSELDTVMEHKYDAWHIVKWLGNKMREAAKTKGCEVLNIWSQKLKTHLWHCISYDEYENREESRSAFNSCLHHILDEHTWDPDDLTGDYTKCGHGPIDAAEVYIQKGSKAEMVLRNIVLSKSFQDDIPKANVIGTSVIECKNFLDSKYVRKETFTPIHTYVSYAKLAALHLNQLTLAQQTGRRTIIKERTIQRKFLTRKSILREKSQVQHIWRSEVIRISCLLQAKQVVDEVQFNTEEEDISSEDDEQTWSDSSTDSSDSE